MWTEGRLALLGFLPSSSAAVRLDSDGSPREVQPLARPWRGSIPSLDWPLRFRFPTQSVLSSSVMYSDGLLAR